MTENSVPMRHPYHVHTTAPVCPACGFDMRGLDDRPCPECGRTPEEAVYELARRARFGRRGFAAFILLMLGVMIVMLAFGPASRYEFIPIGDAALVVYVGAFALAMLAMIVASTARRLADPKRVVSFGTRAHNAMRNTVATAAMFLYCGLATPLAIMAGVPTGLTVMLLIVALWTVATFIYAMA